MVFVLLLAFSFAAKADAAKLAKYRESELKHGRWEAAGSERRPYLQGPGPKGECCVKMRGGSL